MRAPCAVYSSSGIVLPTPAPDWMSTSCSCSTSSLTPAGVSDTRYSSVLISVGTPTFMRCQSSLSSYVTSSRARSASQNSIRSRALDRSRPVSCSTRLMRYRSVCLWQ